MKLNLRTFTAQLPKGVVKRLNNKYFAEHLRSFLFVVLLILAGILLQLLVFLNKKYSQAKVNYQKTLKNYTYWSSVASQYPNIPDILYNAGVSAIAMGREDVALGYLNKAIQIDPLFAKAIELRDSLIGNKK